MDEVEVEDRRTLAQLLPGLDEEQALEILRMLPDPTKRLTSEDLRTIRSVVRRIGGASKRLPLLERWATGQITADEVEEQLDQANSAETAEHLLGLPASEVTDWGKLSQAGRRNRFMKAALIQSKHGLARATHKPPRARNGVDKFLRQQDCTGADLAGASLHRADLTRARLPEAQLWGADLSEASLFDADLWGADLTRANLSKASLKWAKLWGAKLIGAELTDTDLFRADLTATNLTRALLLRSRLLHCLLAGAILRQAKIRDANLSYADLTGADFTDAELSNIDLEGAFFDDQTRWPSREWHDQVMARSSILLASQPEAQELLEHRSTVSTVLYVVEPYDHKQVSSKL